MGFAAQGPRRFHRVVNGIYQLIYFQLHGRGGGDFETYYTAFPLFAGTASQLSPGMTLERAQGVEMWLPSATPEKADRSVAIALETARRQCFPLLDRLKSARSYLDWVSRQDFALPHLYVAPALAFAGRYADAQDMLERADLSDDDNLLALLAALRAGRAPDFVRERTQLKVAEFGLSAAAIHGLSTADDVG